MHAANAALNVGVGLVLGLGFHRWQSAAVSAGAGILIGELQIWTMPDRLEGSSLRRPSASPPIVVPWFGSQGAGVALAATF
jgi:hypothetical protein